MSNCSEHKKDLFAPFYSGQRVVAVDAINGCAFTNGKEYIIKCCEYKMNPVNRMWFWYVGIAGVHDWLRPGIFAPIHKNFIYITFEKLNELEKVSSS